MKNKNYGKEFAAALLTIHEKGIQSLDQLKLPCNQESYEKLCLTARDFICYHALYSKSHGSSKGKCLQGNQAKIRALLSRGMELEDIRSDVFVYVISKLDYILSQPIEKQANYTYCVINNYILSKFKELPPANITVMSLNQQVRGQYLTSDNPSEIQDFIATLDTAESEVIAKETAEEYAMAQKTKILEEIMGLSQRPAEVFMRLCVYLRKKPADIAELLMEKGLVQSYVAVLAATAQKYHIPFAVMGECLGKNAICQETFKLNTKDKTQISAQVSRLIYRANKRLQK